MKVLVTGGDGFIAKNLIESLNRIETEIYTFNRGDSRVELEESIQKVDFIFHIAGVNRPKDQEEFYKSNTELTGIIINLIIRSSKKIPILFTSSTWVGADNNYAKSKKLSEKIIEEYSTKYNVSCFIYRLPNIFGKWSKPNYNSVVATWCYNIARGLDIEITDRSIKLNLVYIDDIIEIFINSLNQKDGDDLYYTIDNIYIKTLGEVESLLYQFRDSRENLLVANIAHGFERALYATYLSFLPKDKFSYRLDGHSDNRGTFYEILKTIDSGQLSISTTKPGITRGNHYHNTKNEKFLVIKGKALIELREICSKEIIQYHASGDNLEIVEMIPGYTHNISNTGKEEMILLIWANENYNPQKPDTNFLEV